MKIDIYWKSGHHQRRPEGDPLKWLKIQGERPAAMLIQGPCQNQEYWQFAINNAIRIVHPLEGFVGVIQ